MYDLAKFAYQVVGAKTSIPTTVLFGSSAEGLNATGEGDRTNFYDKIRTLQFNIIPQLTKMYTIVNATQNGYQEFTGYTFNNLEVPNSREKMENIKSLVETGKNIIEMGADSESVLNWLKSNKDLGLQNVEIDSHTDDLEEYDDTTDGIESQKVANAWDENKHPRDKDGKFGNGSGQSSVKIISIKGNELGEFTTKEELRDKAREYYEKHLANTEVDHPKLGKILFTKNGFKKPISFSGDERKLKLFPYLPDIIKNGELLEDNSDKYGRTNVFNFYTLKSKINIDGKDEVVRVSVRKDNNGRLYYDHVIQKDIGFRKTPSGYKSGGPKTSDNSVPQEDYIVNIFFEDEE